MYKWINKTFLSEFLLTRFSQSIMILKYNNESKIQRKKDGIEWIL